MARFQGFTLFVAGALPGDRVLARVGQIKARYGRAYLHRLISSGSGRQQPPCPIYNTCGGCQIQHLSYPSQVKQKRQWVEDALLRIGKLEGVEVKETLAMQDPWAYRNKGNFPVGQIQGRLAAGAYAKNSHDLVDFDACLIQHPFNMTILQATKKMARDYGFTAYDRRSRRGLLRHIVVRTGFNTGEALLVLVTSSWSRRIKALAKELMEQIPQLVGVVHNINSKPGSIIFGPKMQVLEGRGYYTDTLFDLRFNISASSFYQVNPPQTEILYAKALEYAKLSGSETVVDAYCGIGTISLYLARRAKKVIGIEINKEAVLDARKNARLNQISNAEFIAAPAEKILPKLYAQGLRPQVIILDPPRAGCAPDLLRAVAKMQPQRLVYVSCNPATLARDLAHLAEDGFKIEEVQPVDMFPHTGHVETVVLMSRNI